MMQVNDHDNDDERRFVEDQIQKTEDSSVVAKNETKDHVLSMYHYYREQDLASTSTSMTSSSTRGSRTSNDNNKNNGSRRRFSAIRDSNNKQHKHYHPYGGFHGSMSKSFQPQGTVEVPLLIDFDKRQIRIHTKQGNHHKINSAGVRTSLSCNVPGNEWNAQFHGSTLIRGPMGSATGSVMLTKHIWHPQLSFYQQKDSNDNHRDETNTVSSWNKNNKNNKKKEDNSSFQIVSKMAVGNNAHAMLGAIYHPNVLNGTANTNASSPSWYGMGLFYYPSISSSSSNPYAFNLSTAQEMEALGGHVMMKLHIPTPTQNTSFLQQVQQQSKTIISYTNYHETVDIQVGLQPRKAVGQQQQQQQQQQQKPATSLLLLSLLQPHVHITLYDIPSFLFFTKSPTYRSLRFHGEWRLAHYWQWNITWHQSLSSSNNNNNNNKNNTTNNNNKNNHDSCFEMGLRHDSRWGLSWIIQWIRGDVTMTIPIAFLFPSSWMTYRSTKRMITTTATSKNHATTESTTTPTTTTATAMMYYSLWSIGLGIISYAIQECIAEISNLPRDNNNINNNNNNHSPSGQSVQQLQYIQKAKADAMTQSKLMTRQATSRRKMEQDIQGLIITKAIYYCQYHQHAKDKQKNITSHDDNDDEDDTHNNKKQNNNDSTATTSTTTSMMGEFWDVTIPLQFWVTKSRLDLPSSSKQSMLGFYNVEAAAAEAAAAEAAAMKNKMTKTSKTATQSSSSNQWFEKLKQRIIIPFLSFSSSSSSSSSWWTAEEDEIWMDVPKLSIQYLYGGELFEITILDHEPLSLPSHKAIPLRPV